jgi:methylphosphotriester-DNA--protein-cysteine methyltransferase
MQRKFMLLGPDGKPDASARPGTLGGHRGTRIYGRLDCPGALRAIARGGYVRSRVFFLNRTHARAAGYRPCAVCLPKEYAAWKSTGKK